MSTNTAAPTITAFAVLSAMNTDQLATHIKSFVLTGQKALEMGKAIVAVERNRSEDEQKKSIRSYMKTTFGEIDANAYKPARVFRDLVVFSDTAGHGQILESHFDALASISIQIEASAILGLIEKAYEKDETAQATHKESLADVLRSHTDMGKTLKVLRRLKEDITPAPVESEGSEKKEKEEEQAEDERIPLTPMALLGLLTREVFQSLAKEDGDLVDAELTRIATNCQKVLEYRAGIKAATVAAETPVETPAVVETAAA